MDLNELVVEQIISSEREKIRNGFNKKLETALKEKQKKISSEFQMKIKSITDELEEKNNSISKLLEVQAENEKLKRNNEISKKKLDVELERAKTELSRSITEELTKSISSKFELQLAEKDKQIEQVKKSAEEAAKRANQGSMQLQGEVQEEAIEKWLLNQFPLDKIQGQKGRMGADCLQIVNEFDAQNYAKSIMRVKNVRIQQRMDWRLKDIELQTQI